MQLPINLSSTVYQFRITGKDTLIHQNYHGPRYQKEERRSTRKKNTKMGKGIDITYMCSYGRKDYRPQSTEQELDAHSDAQVQKNVRSESNVRKRRRLGRKRGCLCTFTISQLPDSHMNAVIKYRERRHVDKNGWPCHGPDDPTTREGYFL
ncbi:uncharacterized protein LOC18445750 isoform X3 [Amborella trichopoda]|uniref:uncharacterized protein LOC18445750 isoform X3 n=1 Tax=Amborella trichopoda TaxID=13333 RepID=UPI0009BC9FCF|nr:uncharacterized protein LOC18445750 isoform X3 [Amborella trichopoda]|eukprot:XP_020530093.1 uncharacterized protein LOC18445750 isoform X3 [Amborella trichopoda]